MLSRTLAVFKACVFTGVTFSLKCFETINSLTRATLAPTDLALKEDRLLLQNTKVDM